MRNILYVGAGGFLGAITRYGLNVLVAQFWFHRFPLATFVINITGSFALGLIATVATDRFDPGIGLKLFAATGFLGAYTTFSTFEFETNSLLVSGSYGWAIANVAGSVILGLFAVQLGIAVARW